MREKKLGLFGNAKYSRPVFKNVSEAVVKGVDKDIALLVRHEPSGEVRKWAKAPHASGDADSLAASAAVAPMNSRRALYRSEADADQPSRHAAQFQAVAAMSSAAVPPVVGYAANQLRELSSGASEAKRQRLESLSERCLPIVPPMQCIANNILSACPKITLRDSDTAEYSDQVFALARNALILQINKTLSVSAKTKNTSSSANDGEGNTANSADLQRSSQFAEKTKAVAPDLFNTLCNKTSIFEDDSDDFEESEALDSESPTRIFSTTNKSFGGGENFFDVAAFDTQSSVGEDSNGSDFTVNAGQTSFNAPNSPENMCFFTKRPQFDKTVSFNFDHLHANSDEDFPPPSEAAHYSPTNFSLNNTTNNCNESANKAKEGFFPNKEEMFLDNLSFDFGNSAPLDEE